MGFRQQLIAKWCRAYRNRLIGSAIVYSSISEANLSVLVLQGFVSNPEIQV